jgi:para-nitrobenzyl esterase
MKILLTAMLLLPAIVFASAVDVSQGRLRGNTADGVHSFKGIPYALAPVADLRWAPTQPARAWEGIRDAEQFGSDCTQEPRKRRSP